MEKEKTLYDKVKDSIMLIQRAEKLALKMSDEDGFWVGFSGGKDSQVLLDLVKRAGVKFKAVYNVTTNDPAENIRFIRKHYPEVEFQVPPHSYFQMIERKGLPTMLNRWCCAEFKERAGVGHVVLTGVRREESKKRAEYNEVTKWDKRNKKGVNMNLDDMENNEFRCIEGKEKIMVYPILEWTEKDIWEYIRFRLPINPCYSKFSRVGCIFCPFARKSSIEEYISQHPKVYKSFLHAIERYINRSEAAKSHFSSAEDMFSWWRSKRSYKEWSERNRKR